MDSGTERNPDGPSTDAYWRRRVVALGGAVATVALLAWACGSGGEDKKEPVRNAAAAGSPSPGALPSAMPTVTVTATQSVTVAPTAKKDGDACEPQSVVVTMAPTKKTYGGGEQPQIQLTVVNTGARACTFGVGPKELEVRIASGSDRVWSSAHCARGTGSSIQMLKRGVPFISTVTWDRKRSTDGCSGRRSTIRPGTYVASLNAKKHKVKKQPFQLR